MIEEENYDPYYTDLNLYDKCELHAEQPLRIVCLDCEECVCDECFKFIHSSHRREELADYNSSQLEVLRDLGCRLSETAGKTKNVLDCLTTKIRRSRTMSVLATNEIAATAEHLMQEITRQKEELARSIFQKCSACTRPLEQQKEALLNRLTHFKLIHERIETVKRSEDPNKFFKNVEGLKKHCTGALNLKSLSSLPVFLPEFRKTSALLSKMKKLQIGIVVDSKGQNCTDTDENIYEIGEDFQRWVYDIRPLPVDSVNNSGENDDIKTEKHDDTSAGSSHYHSSSEQDDKQAQRQVEYNSSADSSYMIVTPSDIQDKHLNYDVDFSIGMGTFDDLSARSADTKTYHEQKQYIPEECSKDEPARSNEISPVSDGTVTRGVQLNDHSLDKNYFTTQKDTASTGISTDQVEEAIPNEKQVDTRKKLANASVGHYSFARQISSSNTGRLALDTPDSTGFPSVDDETDDDMYECLHSEHETPNDIDKYYTFLGSSLFLDQIDDEKLLPPTFQLNFKKYRNIETKNTALSGKVLKRVFLPFTIIGSTTVFRENDMLLAFVTTEKEVIIIRKNGVELGKIRELLSPFDVGSSGRFPYRLYITDGGSGPGEGSIRVYSCSGVYLDTFAGGLKAPRGIDLSIDGYVFVCDQVDRCVYGFSPKGRNTFKLNIVGPGVPVYVTSLSDRRLAISANIRENLIIHHLDKPEMSLVKTKLNGLPCQGMFCEDVEKGILYVVHPEANSLRVIREGQQEVISLGTDNESKPLVPMIDERGNIFVF